MALESPILFPLLALLVTVAAVTGAASGAWRPRAPHHFLGWAHGIAAGLMLGLAYLLSAASAGRPPLGIALGSVLGVVGVFALHRWLGVGEMDRLAGDRPSGEGVRSLLAASVLHDGVEGVALGCALVLDPWLGIAAAGTLAIHNVAESGSLAAVLAGTGRRPWRVFTETVMTNLPLPLVALLVWGVIGHGPSAWFFTFAIGLAVGALIYLVLVDLLPEAYERSGQTSIALLVSAGVALVVALEGWVR